MGFSIGSEEAQGFTIGGEEVAGAAWGSEEFWPAGITELYLLWESGGTASVLYKSDIDFSSISAFSSDLPSTPGHYNAAAVDRVNGFVYVIAVQNNRVYRASISDLTTWNYTGRTTSRRSTLACDGEYLYAGNHNGRKIARATVDSAGTVGAFADVKNTVSDVSAMTYHDGYLYYMDEASDRTWRRISTTNIGAATDEFLGRWDVPFSQTWHTTGITGDGNTLFFLFQDNSPPNRTRMYKADGYDIASVQAAVQVGGIANMGFDAIFGIIGSSAPTPTYRHQTEVTLGGGARQPEGYATGRYGSVVDATYTLPDGSTGTITALFTAINSNTDIRFTLQGTIALNQFPGTIEIEEGGTTRRYTRGTQVSAVGLGSAVDYTGPGGANPYDSGDTITVTLRD